MNHTAVVPEYQAEYDAIAVESLATTVVWAADTFVTGINAFMTNAHTAINTALGNIKQDLTLGFKSDKSLPKIIGEVPYISLGHVTVFVPHGFTGKLLPYVGTLEASQGVLEQITTDLLIPARIWFSSLLANPAKLGSISALHDGNMIKFHTETINAAKAQFAKMFSSASGDTQLPFGKVFERTADWDSYAARVTVLEHRLKAVDHKELIASVEALTDITERLHKRISGDSERYRMTTAVGGAIAETIYMIAAELEFVAAYRQMANILIKCSEDSQGKLKDNLK